MSDERIPTALKTGKRGRPVAGQRLSEAQFAAVALLLGRVSNERLNLAKLHLVDGLMQSAIADKYGCTRQNVNGAVQLVLKASHMLEEASKLAGKA
jgi:hypothetical protein